MLNSLQLHSMCLYFLIWPIFRGKIHWFYGRINLRKNTFWPLVLWKLFYHKTDIRFAILQLFWKISNFGWWEFWKKWPCKNTFIVKVTGSYAHPNFFKWRKTWFEILDFETWSWLWRFEKIHYKTPKKVTRWNCNSWHLFNIFFGSESKLHICNGIT